MGVDLHTHSNVSDGTQPPSQVVTTAARAGLEGLALTDHDTVDGWAEAMRAADEAGILLIPGMEITTLTDDRISVHILSYLHDPAHSGLAAAVRNSRKSRIMRARRMAERLAQDYPISWEAVMAQVSEGATVGRPHVADALVAAGVVQDRAEAFARILHKGSQYYVRHESIHPVAAIRLVREAGGVPVLAHGMAAARGRTVSHEQLDEMVGAGLGGVEVRHRDNPEEGRRVLTEVAHAHGLLITGASDYQGAGKPNLIGENVTDLDTVAELIDSADGSPAYGRIPL